MSDSEEDDPSNDLCILGNQLHASPLEDDDGDRVIKARDRSITRVDKDIATDERGRRRFHGAFSGGFSAGYFNTVGSKEGWEPSNFRSSRDGKADSHEQRPEDFMDEEDMGEHGIAPRRVAARDMFASSRRPDAASTKSGASAASRDFLAPLLDSIEPTRSSFGAQILQKMGWREGRILGPKMYASLSSVVGEGDAPEGNEVESVEQLLRKIAVKNDTKGIGYFGMRAPTLADETSRRSRAMVTPSDHRKGIRGQAFGVGVFEDEDDSVYGQAAFSEYDFVLDGPDDAKQTAPDIPASVQKPSLPFARVFENFTLDETLSSTTAQQSSASLFPPPTVADGFVPFHRFEKSANIGENWWNTFRMGSKAAAEVKGPSESVPQKRLSAYERGAMLGEFEESSVMSLVSADARDKILSAAKPQPPRTDAGTPAAPAPTDTKKKELLDAVAKRISSFTPSSATTAKASSSLSEPSNQIQSQQPGATAAQSEVSVCDGAEMGAIEPLARRQQPLYSGGRFRPFQHDAGKQRRYDVYCDKIAAGIEKEEAYRVALAESSSGVGGTEWERSHEADEFARAAALYRTSISFSISSRFTQATLSDSVLGGTETMSLPPAAESDREKAARMKMFGVLTRSVHEWFPSRMLCKRCNVPVPSNVLRNEAKQNAIPVVETGAMKGAATKRKRGELFDYLSDVHNPTTAAAAAQPKSVSSSSAASFKHDSIVNNSSGSQDMEVDGRDTSGDSKQPAADIKLPPVDLFAISRAHNDETAVKSEDAKDLKPSLKSRQSLDGPVDEKQPASERLLDEVEQCVNRNVAPSMDIFAAIFGDSDDDEQTSDSEKPAADSAKKEESEGKDDVEFKPLEHGLELTLREDVGGSAEMKTDPDVNVKTEEGEADEDEAALGESSVWEIDNAAPHSRFGAPLPPKGRGERIRKHKKHKKKLEKEAAGDSLESEKLVSADHTTENDVIAIPSEGSTNSSKQTKHSFVSSREREQRKRNRKREEPKPSVFQSSAALKTQNRTALSFGDEEEGSDDEHMNAKISERGNATSAALSMALPGPEAASGSETLVSKAESPSDEKAVGDRCPSPPAQFISDFAHDDHQPHEPPSPSPDYESRVRDADNLENSSHHVEVCDSGMADSDACVVDVDNSEEEAEGTDCLFPAFAAASVNSAMLDVQHQGHQEQPPLASRNATEKEEVSELDALVNVKQFGEDEMRRKLINAIACEAPGGALLVFPASSHKSDPTHDLKPPEVTAPSPKVSKSVSFADGEDDAKRAVDEEFLRAQNSQDYMSTFKDPSRRSSQTTKVADSSEFVAKLAKDSDVFSGGSSAKLGDEEGTLHSVRREKCKFLFQSALDDDGAGQQAPQVNGSEMSDRKREFQRKLADATSSNVKMDSETALSQTLPISDDHSLADDLAGSREKGSTTSSRKAYEAYLLKKAERRRRRRNREDKVPDSDSSSDERRRKMKRIAKKAKKEKKTKKEKKRKKAAQVRTKGAIDLTKDDSSASSSNSIEVIQL